MFWRFFQFAKIHIIFHCRKEYFYYYCYWLYYKYISLHFLMLKCSKPYLIPPHEGDKVCQKRGIFRSCFYLLFYTYRLFIVLSHGCKKTKVPPWFAGFLSGSVVETVGAKIRTISDVAKWKIEKFCFLSLCLLKINNISAVMFVQFEGDGFKIST